MNLELIKEIQTLKDSNKSYTEIAELTGIARTSIVLSLRLSTIFNTSYAQQISSLNKDKELLNATIETNKNSLLAYEAEISRLNSLIDIDFSRDMLIEKSKFKSFKNELDIVSKEVDVLSRKLRYKEQYLKNLSFIDKMKILFS